MRIPHKIIKIAIVSLLILSACTKQESEQKEEEAAEHQENVITLSDESLKHIELEVVPVILGDLGMTLKVAGRVTLNLNNTAKITPTIEGRITAINADLNDAVKKGTLLAGIESPEFVGKEVQLRSPIDGVIINRTGAVGELVDRSKELFTVSNPRELWVIAEVKERDIASIKVGQDATFEVLSFPGRKLQGKVILVGNQVEEDSRTVEVRILTDNTEGLLRPGMFADVSITTTILEKTLAIPDDALQTDEDRQVVFVALDGNRFEKRQVAVGLEQEGKVQIINGLKEGESVATKGSFVLKSELLKGELGEE